MTDLSSHDREPFPYYIQIVVVLLLAVGLYFQTITYDFVYDDFLQIVLNQQVSTSPNSGILKLLAEPTPPGNLYRPISTFTYAITATYFGMHPGIYHATNILLYAATCVLTLLSLRIITANRTAAWIGTILFTIHPLHTEAVANIIGRAEQLATFFSLLTFLSMYSATRSLSGGRIGVYTSFSAVFFLLAALCKESSLTLLIPICFAMWHLIPANIPRQVYIVKIFPVVAALISTVGIALFLRSHALGSNFIIEPDGKIWVENPLFNEPFINRIIPSCAILGTYLRLLLLPLHQSADYSSSPTYFYQWLGSTDGVVSLTTVLLSLYIWWRVRTPRISMLFLWTFTSFLLTINLVTPIGTVMGERLSFAASFGTCGLLGLLFSYWIHSRRMRSLIVVGCYGAILVILTILRVEVWKTNATLFSATVKDAPYSPKAWYNYGVQAVLEDPTSVQGEESFRTALSLYPNYLLPARAIADIMLARKDFGRLEYWYREILKLSPEDETVRAHLSELTQFKEKYHDKSGDRHSF